MGIEKSREGAMAMVRYLFLKNLTILYRNKTKKHEIKLRTLVLFCNYCYPVELEYNKLNLLQLTVKKENL